MSPNLPRYITIFVLGVTAVTIMVWRAFSLTPEYETYSNANLGFSLKLPSDWTGHYLTQEDEYELNFLYKAEEGEPELLFGLARVGTADWQARSMADNFASTSRLLWQDGRQVLYAHWSVSSPYDDEDDTWQYLKMLRQVSQILDSMEFAQAQPSESEVCIQVITPARNPNTGETKEFPTPCDVPADWELIK